MPKTLDELVRDALEIVTEIPPSDAVILLAKPDRGGWSFVDVREADEFVAGRIPGARHSPRGFLEVHADLEHAKRDPWWSDRSRPIICYCGGGNRSVLAAQSLIAMGFSDLKSLAGGFSAWTASGLPIET
jgi:rhodanese-related sulfurtransferase